METQKNHHSGKSIPNCREHVQKKQKSIPNCREQARGKEKKSTANCRQRHMRVPETTRAWVSEQARGEVQQPGDQVHLHAGKNEQVKVHLHAGRNKKVNVPEFPWTATWSAKHPHSSDGLVEDQSDASGERCRFVSW